MKRKNKGDSLQDPSRKSQKFDDHQSSAHILNSLSARFPDTMQASTDLLKLAQGLNPSLLQAQHNSLLPSFNSLPMTMNNQQLPISASSFPAQFLQADPTKQNGAGAFMQPGGYLCYPPMQFIPYPFLSPQQAGQQQMPTMSMPGMTAMPGMTGMSGMSAMPGMPGMPGMSAMPGMPGTGMPQPSMHPYYHPLYFQMMQMQMGQGVAQQGAPQGAPQQGVPQGVVQQGVTQDVIQQGVVQIAARQTTNQALPELQSGEPSK